MSTRLVSMLIPEMLEINWTRMKYLSPENFRRLQQGNIATALLERTPPPPRMNSTRRRTSHASHLLPGNEMIQSGVSSTLKQSDEASDCVTISSFSPLLLNESSLTTLVKLTSRSVRVSLKQLCHPARMTLVGRALHHSCAQFPFRLRCRTHRLCRCLEFQTSRC